MDAITVTLSPNNRLVIDFKNTDGSLEIEFEAATSVTPGYIRVVADLPDSSGRSGEIYKEEFGGAVVALVDFSGAGDIDDAPFDADEERRRYSR